ncbi:hypothetical protein [Dyadobacter sp. LHD-138]|uniref:hypothetical protein n=1 Tax=Dyadobacter sp. LHD-138 TaxID=3071413 RepID=UPI0027DF69E4|nr:hypothetical protein [Dyadobacter sp. LHD-138]MDQ6482223.1 hypothetical protein [Dyadobacter sp. LHD-138]
MGIKARFTTTDFRRELEKRMVRIDKAIILNLQVLGEQLVNHARTLATYKDQTGNLRASLGYVLVVNGKIYTHYFPDTKIGAQSGKKLADELANRAVKGYALIVVAGMNYASAVESMGYDVLASAELLASRELPKVRQKLKKQIEQMK